MSRKALPWWLGAGASLFYLCYPSYFFNFDGVACAIAVDLGDWAHLVHGNHLGYGPLALIFARFWGLLGYSGPSLPLLGALDSLLGGAGVGAFAALLLRVGLGPWGALAGGLALASSYAWWFWSLEAQVYMLGALFMILAASEVISERPRPLRVGLLLSVAVLGHVGHLFFVPAGLYALASGPAGDRRRWRPFLLSLILTTAGAYALAGLLCVRPTNFGELRLWLLGSAAANCSGETFAASAALVSLFALIFMVQPCLSRLTSCQPGSQGPPERNRRDRPWWRCLPSCWCGP